MEEFLEIVDKDGRILSIAPRSIIHGNPSMLHKVIHVLVFNSKSELLLQKKEPLIKMLHPINGIPLLVDISCPEKTF